MDSLDIKELSGALNLGNNFTPTVNKEGQKKSSQKKASSNKNKQKKKEEKGKNNDPNEEEMEQTSNGYRVKL